jgi:hypothetical protein
VRTDHGDDEHDEESVAHGDERRGEGGEDLLGRLQAAEEAHHAEGAQDADGEVEGPQGGQGHGDHQGVEDGPAICRELAKPVAEKVEHELEGEDYGEAKVGCIQSLLYEGGGPIGQVKLALFQLRLKNGDAEILLATSRVMRNKVYEYEGWCFF